MIDLAVTISLPRGRKDDCRISRPGKVIPSSGKRGTRIVRQ